MTDPKLPDLQKPGAGLPLIEGLVARYILFPSTTRRLSRPQAIQMLCKIGQKAITSARSFSPEEIKQRILIKRFPGIEDSSRYWSILMTVNHLWITGESMAQVTERLVQNKPVNTVVSIEAVKPNPEESLEEIFSGYEDFLSRYQDRMEKLTSGDFSIRKHVHPWFGPINAHQWLCLNAMHHKIHLAQIEKIIQGLANTSV